MVTRSLSLCTIHGVGTVFPQVGNIRTLCDCVCHSARVQTLTYVELPLNSSSTYAMSDCL